MTVTAFATKHAMESFGYRFDAPDRSVVISGDTIPTEATIDACIGCEVLIHEVLTHEWLAKPATFTPMPRVVTPPPRSSSSSRTRRGRNCWCCTTPLFHCGPQSIRDAPVPRAPFAEMAGYKGLVVVGRDLDSTDGAEIFVVRAFRHTNQGFGNGLA